MGPLIWYVNAQVRMWIILDINYKHYYHLGKSQICAGAGDYFRTSKPHSEKLCPEFSKASPTFYILMILKEGMAKNQKIKKSENLPISANPDI